MSISCEVKPTVSVVICCYNSAKRLARTLAAALACATESNGEVVIVDNGCTDRTVDVTWDIATRAGFSRLVVVRENRPGQMYARLAGIAAARGEYICFLDDDNRLFPGYLEHALGVFVANPNVAILGGRSVLPRDALVPDWIRPWLKAYAIGSPHEHSRVLRSGEYVWGAGMCLRKEAIRDLQKCWNPVLLGRMGSRATAGDDGEIVCVLQILGWRAAYDERMVFVHDVDIGRLSLLHLARTFFGFGLAWPILRRLQRAALLSAGGQGLAAERKYLFKRLNARLSMLTRRGVIGPTLIELLLRSVAALAAIYSALFNREGIRRAERQLLALRKCRMNKGTRLQI